MKDKYFNPYNSIDKQAQERAERGYRTEIKVSGPYNLDKALKILEGQIKKAGIRADLKKHSASVKPSEKKHREELRGIKNTRKRMKEMAECGGRKNPNPYKFPENLQVFGKDELEEAVSTLQIQNQDEEDSGDGNYHFGGRFSKAKVFVGSVGPQIFQSDNDIQTIAAKVIATLNNFIVVILVKTKKDRYGNMLFGFPGGKLENPDEGAVSAGEREFREETGVEISLSPSDFFSYLPLKNDDTDSKKIIAIAATSLDDLDDVQFKPGEEIEGVFLMTIEEIKKLIKNSRFVKSDAIFFQDYLTKKLARV